MFYLRNNDNDKHNNNNNNNNDNESDSDSDNDNDSDNYKDNNDNILYLLPSHAISKTTAWWHHQHYWQEMIIQLRPLPVAIGYGHRLLSAIRN